MILFYVVAAGLQGLFLHFLRICEAFLTSKNMSVLTRMPILLSLIGHPVYGSYTVHLIKEDEGDHSV